MPQKNEDEDILEEAKVFLQKIGELFAQTFTELLKEKQAQAAILIKINKAVAEFKQFQETSKKHGVNIGARLTSFTAEVVIQNLNKKPKPLLTKEDSKFLESLKIIPPDVEN